MENITFMEGKSGDGEIVVYQPDEITRLEVIVKDETVWLTQDQIAKVFSVGRPAITKHIRNVYLCEELDGKCRLTTIGLTLIIHLLLVPHLFLVQVFR